MCGGGERLANNIHVHNRLGLTLSSVLGEKTKGLVSHKQAQSPYW